MAVGFLIGTITHNKQAIGGIVNVVALGTSFLCGCFVPMSFMPSYVLKIAHILPTYYFVQNNELIKTNHLLYIVNNSNLDSNRKKYFEYWIKKYYKNNRKQKA